MFTTYRRRWQLSRVRPGDGSPLPPFRLWQVFTRSVFAVDLPDQDGGRFEVDLRPGAEGSTRRSPASLYRNGAQVARANLPATFPVPGGVVEVAAGQYGVKRAHLVTDGGAEHLLTPHPGSLEGRRARLARRFPRASWAVGVVAVVVILVGGLLALGRGLEAITHSPAIAAQVGTFTMPFHLSTTGLVVVGVLTALAGTERAITFRSRFLIDRRPGRRARG